MSTPTKSTLAAVLALLIAYPGVQAASAATASASLTNIQIELIDLNPSDGLDPWISAVGGGWSAVQIDGSRTAWGDVTNLLSLGGFSGLPLETDMLEHTSADMTGSAQRSESSLNVALGAAPGITGNVYAWFETQFTYGYDLDGNDIRTGTFEIGPWTGLRLSASGSVELQGVNVEPGNFGVSTARLYGAIGTTKLEDFTVDSQELVWVAQQGMTERQLLVVLNNDGDHAQPLLMGGLASASLQVAAVPEPATWLMAIAGGLMLALRRRLHQA